MKDYFKGLYPTILFTLIISILVLEGCSTSSILNNPWEQLTSPSSGPANVIGSYSAGCLKGAQSLYPSGNGYHVLHPSRRRYYGHPNLIRFIEELSAQSSLYHFGTLLIGDLSKPRGGPLNGGHASHQNGLDVDIWFWQWPSHGKNLTLDELERLPAPKMILKTGPEEDLGELFKLNSHFWRDENFQILKLAAKSLLVDRIFVHPSIKRAICANFLNEDWIKKIRPWWGHEDHFHVRLLCPENNHLCTPQNSIATYTNGCDHTLSWWFGAEGLNKKLTSKEKRELIEMKKIKELPQLPMQCQSELLAPSVNIEVNIEKGQNKFIK